jgi:hypothetical protein
LEFAVVAFLLTFLLGAMLTLGFLFFGANVVQQAADVGAMEFARHPFTADGSFDAALQDSGLFREEDLVVPVGTTAADLPLINQLLYSLYIYDPDIDMVRYPGALVTNSNGDRTVLIPIVGQGNRDPDSGVETISEWRHVVEEVLPTGATEGAYSMSSITTGTLDPGMVALRIHYPFQSAASVAYIQKDASGVVIPPTDTIGLDGVQNVAVVADDDAVTAAPLPAGYALVSPTVNAAIGASPHRGTYGLGESQAHLTTVRPYRKVITAQAIYRREVFE